MILTYFKGNPPYDASAFGNVDGIVRIVGRVKNDREDFRGDVNRVSKCVFGFVRFACGGFKGRTMTSE